MMANLPEMAKLCLRQVRGSKRDPWVAGRSLLAGFLAGLLLLSPITPAFAQSPDQNPPQQQAPSPDRPALPTPQTPAQQNAPVLTKPPIPVSLGVSRYDYSKAPRAFPNLARP